MFSYWSSVDAFFRGERRVGFSVEGRFRDSNVDLQ